MPCTPIAGDGCSRNTLRAVRNTSCVTSAASSGLRSPQADSDAGSVRLRGPRASAAALVDDAHYDDDQIVSVAWAIAGHLHDHITCGADAIIKVQTLFRYENLASVKPACPSYGGGGPGTG